LIDTSKAAESNYFSMSVYGRTHEHGAPELHHQGEEDDDWETDPVRPSF
jgi:hypothetical protein